MLDTYRALLVGRHKHLLLLLFLRIHLYGCVHTFCRNWEGALSSCDIQLVHEGVPENRNIDRRSLDEGVVQYVLCKCLFVLTKTQLERYRISRK